MTDGRDLKAGDKAPDFELMTDAGESVRLSELRGHKVILYFYPEDNTPGCTAQAQDFRDTIKDFKALGYSIYGVSNDNQASHCDFRDRYKLTFPLLCDTDRTVSNLYGVMTEQVKDGKPRIRIERSTFVIDENGVLTHVLRNVVARVHGGELLKLLSGKDA